MAVSRALCETVDQEIIVAPGVPPAGPRGRQWVASAMLRRNRWMVDHCDAVIAVWGGSPGGTAQSVRYARDLGRPVYLFNPREVHP
jgi:predicted Rossmann fold nucleotide-binding protein DprA/Smf involved in DNA uptake